MNRTNYDLLESSKERVNEDYIQWTLVYFDKGSGKVLRLRVLESNQVDMPIRTIVSDNNATSNTPETNTNPSVQIEKVGSPDAQNVR